MCTLSHSQPSAIQSTSKKLECASAEASPKKGEGGDGVGGRLRPSDSGVGLHSPPFQQSSEFSPSSYVKKAPYRHTGTSSTTAARVQSALAVSPDLPQAHKPDKKGQAKKDKDERATCLDSCAIWDVFFDELRSESSASADAARSPDKSSEDEDKADTSVERVFSKLALEESKSQNATQPAVLKGLFSSPTSKPDTPKGSDAAKAHQTKTDAFFLKKFGALSSTPSSFVPSSPLPSEPPGSSSTGKHTGTEAKWERITAVDVGIKDILRGLKTPPRWQAGPWADPNSPLGWKGCERLLLLDDPELQYELEEEVERYLEEEKKAKQKCENRGRPAETGVVGGEDDDKTLVGP